MAVVYDNDWYIGCTLERSDEHQDILMKFMNKSKTKILIWPHRDDICWVPITNELCTLSPPMMYGSSARQYH